MEPFSHKSIDLWVTRTPDFLRESLWTLNTSGTFIVLFLTVVKYLFPLSESWIIKLVSLCVDCTQTSYTLPEIIFNCNILGCSCLWKNILILLLYVVKLASCSCGFSGEDRCSSSNFNKDTLCIDYEQNASVRGMSDPIRSVKRCSSTSWNIISD